MPRSSKDESKNEQHKRKLPELGSAAAATPKPSMEENPLGVQSAPPVAPAAPVPLAMAPGPVRPSQQDLFEERGLLLIKLLQACAAASAEGEVDLLNTGLDKISSLASPEGDPMQRLASAFAEALALRVVQPLQGVCRTLQLPQPTPVQVAAVARRNFALLCPFLRLAATAANHAIIDAMQSERNVVHVVDLGGAGPSQWLGLIRLFAARPEGAPNLLRLTVVNDQNEFLSAAAALLTPEAERLHVRFQFHPVKSHIDELLSVEPLGIRSGQALVVTSTLRFHRLLAYEFAAAAAHDRKGKMPEHTRQMKTRADALLRTLHELSPKLMILTEQEADHNGTDFTGRFSNALNYYAALFDTLEESAPRGSVDRICVERWLLRQEIRDIVAFDGTLRRERHEKMARWEARMDNAGFAPVTISYNALVQTAKLAQQLSGEGRAYRVFKDDGCFFLYWHAIPMFSVSTWRASGGSADDARRPAGPSGSKAIL